MREEKRRRSRSALRLEAVLETEASGAWTGACRDLSLNGLFLSGPPPGGVCPGAPCRVEINLRGKTPQISLSIRARVVRVTVDGVGVSFLDMGAETSKHLRNIVLVTAPDPDRIRAELGD